MTKNFKIGAALGLAVMLTLAVYAIMGTKKAGHGEDPSSDPTALVPTEQLLRTRPGSGPLTVFERAAEIDLLNTIQVAEDAVAGDWGFQNRALITSSVPWGRLQLSCVPPEEYDLKLRVTRKRGAGSLDLGIALGGVQGALVLDGEDGTLSWVVRAGTLTAEGNDTARSARIFRWNRPTSLQVSVRKEGISVAAEGKEILRWKGDAKELAIPPGFAVPNGQCLVLGSRDTIFRIDEFILVPVSGSPTFLRKT
jgi:hypothetical protein